MELRMKSSIDDVNIINSLEFDADESEWFPGYFHNVTKIENNNDFLDVYRYVQYFSLEITDDLIQYASIPNYSSKSLIENLKLTGEDSYFERISEYIKNAKYSTKSELKPNEDNEDLYEELASIDRADLTQYYFDEGKTPTDIYVHQNNGNTGLEICNILIENGYIPSDDIIYWYMTKGMGDIANRCICNITDMNFITDCNPIDLTSFEIIKKFKWPATDDIPSDDATIMLYNIISSKFKTDVALFILLYRIIKEDLTQHEKLMLLSSVLAKKERFLILVFLKELSNENIDDDTLENTIFINSRSIIGYQIYKIEIKKCNDYDNIVDYCNNILEDFKSEYYEEESDFISRNNEKYIDTSSSDSSSDDSSSEVNSVPEGDDGIYYSESDNDEEQLENIFDKLNINEN